MTQEQIIEGNKLIAEFMGMPKYQRWEDCVSFQYSTDINFLPREMRYSTSWDWIMPVIKKIISTCKADQELKAIFESMMNINLTTTYTAVIEFIKNFK